ncbi:hypothetical protein AK812_SmicGene28184 [Symbiodinium microadriaticum]|uniref:Uncharacterized protein n=1 Tax=Symbiodinium microadriaticum TaxID=2951 RepID=A0A1Q9D578_SYMMI|nr:hypothetical protein AK812_SmicGene28184 [Symbiodinium microadriaticum]
MHGLHVGRLGCSLRASRLCLQAARGCAGTVASEALEAAAAASTSAPERVALFRHCVDSISALRGAGQDLPWWSAHAVEEEEQMLQDLSRALPRGGRLAPGLLEGYVKWGHDVQRTMVDTGWSVIAAPDERNRSSTGDMEFRALLEAHQLTALNSAFADAALPCHELTGQCGGGSVADVSIDFRKVFLQVFQEWPHAFSVQRWSGLIHRFESKFDVIPRWALSASLTSANLPDELHDLVLDIHMQCQYHIRLGSQSKMFAMQRGIRQGCALSLLNFAIFTGWIFDQLCAVLGKLEATECGQYFATMTPMADAHMEEHARNMQAQLREVMGTCAALYTQQRHTAGLKSAVLLINALVCALCPHHCWSTASAGAAHFTLSGVGDADTVLDVAMLQGDKQGTKRRAVSQGLYPERSKWLKFQAELGQALELPLPETPLVIDLTADDDAPFFGGDVSFTDLSTRRHAFQTEAGTSNLALDEMAMVPTLPAPTEVVARQLPSVLGPREGLTALLHWRVALRRVAEAAPTPQFAVERLEGRLLRLLSLWLNEGFLCCSEVSEVQPDEVRIPAAAAATGDCPDGVQRCFALQMPQMAKAGFIGPPLLALHAAMQPSPDGGQRALIWSLGFCDEVVPPGSLRGFGLGRTLRRAATAQLLAEGAAEVAAAVPLKSFRPWLRRVQPWRQRGLPGEVQAQLDKATSGADLPELSFRDAAGDDVCFRLSGQRHLEVSFNGQSAETVRRLKFLEGAVLVLLGTGGMQIDIPKEETIASGRMVVRHIGPELRQPLLNFAFEYLFFPGEGRASDPLVHFHLLGGGDFASLSFAATESPKALAESFGIFATFRYHGSQDEARRAANYAERGVRLLLEAE